MNLREADIALLVVLIIAVGVAVRWLMTVSRQLKAPVQLTPLLGYSLTVAPDQPALAILQMRGDRGANYYAMYRETLEDMGPAFLDAAKTLPRRGEATLSRPSAEASGPAPSLGAQRT
jgi:hypothetical protein